MLTWQNSASEFVSAPPRIAILPLACYEPHGPHLPVGTDVIMMNEIAQRVASQMKTSTFLLPTWCFGTSIQHAGQDGAVYLKFGTLWAVVRDIVVSLRDHGIDQVAVLNNHGSAKTTTSRPLGNFIVKTAVRQLNSA